MVEIESNASTSGPRRLKKHFWLFCGLLHLVLLAGCQAGPPAGGKAPVVAEGFPVRMEVIESERGRLFVRQRRAEVAQTALITIHGGPGMQSDYLWELEQLAGARLSVVSYDQHGSGRSRPSTFDMTMDSYLEELERVADFVGYQRLILFGHSWGGLVAVNYAARNPQQVVGLILMGPAPLTFQELYEGADNFQGRVERLVAQGAISPGPYELAEFLPAYFADPDFRAPAVLTDIDYSRVVNTATWQALGDYDFRQQAREINIPALVLWGQGDPFGVEWGRSVSQSIGESGSRFALLEDCGHYWHECPEQFYEEVQGFLSELGSH